MGGGRRDGHRVGVTGRGRRGDTRGGVGGGRRDGHRVGVTGQGRAVQQLGGWTDPQGQDRAACATPLACRQCGGIDAQDACSRPPVVGVSRSMDKPDIMSCYKRKKVVV